MTSDSYTFILVLVDTLQDLYILPNLPTIADAMTWSSFDILVTFSIFWDLAAYTQTLRLIPVFHYSE